MNPNVCVGVFGSGRVKRRKKEEYLGKREQRKAAGGLCGRGSRLNIANKCGQFRDLAVHALQVADFFLI